MKIAIISDVHNNIYGLNSILEDIDRKNIDVIVGAGDMVGCSAYLRPIDVWDELKRKRISTVLGNEEERLLRYYEPFSDSLIKSSVQFMPLQYFAKQFSSNHVNEMKTLPLGVTIDGPKGQDVFVCHASPNNLYKSPMREIDEEMETELKAVNSKVVVVGHLHSQWHRYWEEKLIVMAGSAGLPLRGKVDEVDYLILTYRRNRWEFQYETVKYDYQAAITDVVKSDFLEQSGPIGWLMFDEILTQEDRLILFLTDFCPKVRDDSMEYWRKLTINFLEQIDRWAIIRPYIQPIL